MANRSSDTRPRDPRDRGGRNESGQNPDTQIDLGRQMQKESPEELRRRFRQAASKKDPAHH